jgi:hypothetical protein
VEGNLPRLGTDTGKYNKDLCACTAIRTLQLALHEQPGNVSSNFDVRGREGMPRALCGTEKSVATNC